jgi:hypothetical protein
MQQDLGKSILTIGREVHQENVKRKYNFSTIRVDEKKLSVCDDARRDKRSLTPEGF